MILLSLGMIVLFLGPLIIIGAIQNRKDARRKQKASKQWNKRVCQFDTPAIYRISYRANTLLFQ